MSLGNEILYDRVKILFDRTGALIARGSLYNE